MVDEAFDLARPHLVVRLFGCDEGSRKQGSGTRELAEQLSQPGDEILDHRVGVPVKALRRVQPGEHLAASHLPAIGQRQYQRLLVVEEPAEIKIRSRVARLRACCTRTRTSGSAGIRGQSTVTGPGIRQSRRASKRLVICSR